MNLPSRYPRPSRQTIRATAKIVAAVVLVELVVLAAWWTYSQSRLGRIELSSEQALLTVEVLDESGEVPIGEPIDVIKKTTLALPDGEYQLRVNGDGRLGRTYRVAVNRGETIEHQLYLDEGRLLGRDHEPSWTGDRPREQPMPFAMLTRALELTPGKADLVEYTGQTIIRRDGVTGAVVWDAADHRAWYAAGRDPRPLLPRIREYGFTLSFVEPAVDLDGDGTRDVIVVVGSTNAIIALSGKDGSMLWNHALEQEGINGLQPEGPELIGPIIPPRWHGQFIGQPSIDDVDHDGTPDLIATKLFQESQAEIARRTGKPATSRSGPLVQRVVQAISGRTGRWLWSFSVDPAFTTIKAQFWDKPAAVVHGRRSSIVAILDGTRWLALEPSTGRPKGNPVDLGFEPVRPLQYADLDGDGEPEIVALGPGSMSKQQSLVGFSSASGRPLWNAAVAAAYSSQSLPFLAEWPWLMDLDGDGRTEVVVPDAGPMPPTAGFRGMKMIDGISGQTRWVRPMRPETTADDLLNHILEAPDLDGDGVRDLIAVSKFDGRNPPATRSEKRSEPERAYADALSGRDGRLLWSWHADLAEGKYTYLWEPRWWGLGPDGWPMLAVSLGGQNPRQPGGAGFSGNFHPATVHILEASTGRERHRVVGMNRIDVADLDGDGLLDLWGDTDGQLRAFRGELPEKWRTLARFSPAAKWDPMSGLSSNPQAVDLDSDGIGDTLFAGLSLSGNSASGPRGSRTAIARSGRDGRLLWKTVLDPPRFWLDRDPARSYGMAAFPLPAGDLDGDGTADVIVQKNEYDEPAITREPASLPIRALSGRTGRPLWSAGPLPLAFEAHGDSTVVWFAPHTIGPKAAPDLLVLHRSPFLKAGSTPAPRSGGTAQDRLARVSGRTGRILWDIAVEEQPSTQQPGTRPVPPKVADLDGDGSMVAVVLARRTVSAGAPSEFELKGISLRDGASRWSRALEYQGFMSEPPGFEIGQAEKGQPATVYITEAPGTQTSNELIVHALDGRDGTIRWTWRSGVGQDLGKVYGGIDPIDLDGKGKDSICVTYSNFRRECHILILDSQGRERARRDIPPEPVPTMYFPPVGDFMLDLDGDGRDELVVWNNNRLSAWGRDMKELWSIPSTNWPSGWFLPSKPGQPCTLLLSPMTAIDGTSGQVRWKDKSRPWGGEYLLDPGDSARRPLLLPGRGPTICRQALPVTTRGDYVMPSGALVPPGLVVDDPRWTRPLPWIEPIRRFDVPRYLLAAIGLALVNVFVPIGILRLAAGRRAWRVRTLMVLPIVVAIPLWVFQTIELLLPARIGAVPVAARAVFVGGTLAGIPIVALVGLAGWCLVRRRWKPLVGIAGLTIVAAAIVAAGWLRYDSRSMPAIEHYGRSGWLPAILLGAYAVGVLILTGWILKRPYRWLTRPRRPEIGTP